MFPADILFPYQMDKTLQKLKIIASICSSVAGSLGLLGGLVIPMAAEAAWYTALISFIVSLVAAFAFYFVSYKLISKIVDNPINFLIKYTYFSMVVFPTILVILYIVTAGTIEILK